MSRTKQTSRPGRPLHLGLAYETQGSIRAARRRRVYQQGLGLSWGDVTNALQRGANVLQQGADYAKAAPVILDAGKGVLEDPYLKETVCNVNRLRAVNAGIYPGPPCPPTPAGSDPRKGIGLRYAVPALHAAVYARQNPWVVPLAAATILGIPFLLGMAVGKRGK
jgi:hypothetical protein